MVKPRIKFVNGNWYIHCLGLVNRKPFIVFYRGSAADAFRHFRAYLYWTDVGPLVSEKALVNRLDLTYDLAQRGEVSPKTAR